MYTIRAKTQNPHIPGPRGGIVFLQTVSEMTISHLIFARYFLQKNGSTHNMLNSTYDMCTLKVKTKNPQTPEPRGGSGRASGQKSRPNHQPTISRLSADHQPSGRVESYSSPGPCKPMRCASRPHYLIIHLCFTM